MTDLSAWGIESGYRDVSDRWHATSPATARAVARLMGADGPSPDPARVRVVPAGQAESVPGRFQLVLEDGTSVTGEGRLPPDLPIGYHQLVPATATEPSRLIVAPSRCHLPAGLRTWGWAVQLPALRSTASWGIGDLGDLATMARWSHSLGAGMTLVSPLHAVPPRESSPYSPSSRCWRNPIYLRVEDVPGTQGCPDLGRAAAAGRALNRERRIDREAVWALKRQALEWAWERWRDDGSFAKWRRSAPASLPAYARFATLAEVHDGPWPRWPRGVRHPAAPGVATALRGLERRVGFHEWLQWLVDRQLGQAAAANALVQDVAVGVAPDGADAWLWQDCFALGARVGAPPDRFNPRGQDWGLPPLDPWRLRGAGFGPFVETVRAGLRHAGGLRVDHVMGLFRLWWIPEGADPAEGVYVRYPWVELLAILAVESVRARGYVVGEDLGTVEPAVRRRLAERGVLSYRLMWFEPEPPGPRWPAQALAAVTTHDLPTVAGLWSGADDAELRALGLPGDRSGGGEIRDRVARWLGLSTDAPVEDVVVAVHRLLARAPSAVLAAQLEDALGLVERPNVPGTTAERRPNWSLALPAPLEEVMGNRTVTEVAAALRR